jgi:hypothetical protein
MREGGSRLKASFHRLSQPDPVASKPTMNYLVNMLHGLLSHAFSQFNFCQAMGRPWPFTILQQEPTVPGVKYVDRCHHQTRQSQESSESRLTEVWPIYLIQCWAKSGFKVVLSCSGILFLDPFIIIGPRANYLLIGTDYTQYASVYSCSAGIQLAFILTRSQTPSLQIVSNIK